MVRDYPFVGEIVLLRVHVDSDHGVVGSNWSEYTHAYARYITGAYCSMQTKNFSS